MEFLIKRTDGDWFDLDLSDYGDVLKPNSFNSEIIEGWGNHRIKIKNCEIAFSYEIAGFQVIFGEGDNPSNSISEIEAEKITKEILYNIEKSTGQKGEFFQVM